MQYGVVYVIAIPWFFDEVGLLSEDTAGYWGGAECSVDSDTRFDLQLAEMMTNSEGVKWLGCLAGWGRSPDQLGEPVVPKAGCDARRVSSSEKLERGDHDRIR